jgi:hypothetical protein
MFSRHTMILITLSELRTADDAHSGVWYEYGILGTIPQEVTW